MELETELHTEEHWADKQGVDLYLRERFEGALSEVKGTVLLVHGSMGGVASFDLAIPDRPHSSLMTYLATQGFDVWAIDCEGYGRSQSGRDINSDIATGSDDLAAATSYITALRGVSTFLIYGISSGALRAALFTERHPDRVRRLALEAFVWTGQDSPTLASRRARLHEFKSANRRPIDRDFFAGALDRDHPGLTDPQVIDALADAILSVSPFVPNGTYVDMCENLPLVQPRAIEAPVLIMRGVYDGIASLSDLLAFFDQLGSSFKQFTVMPGISHGGFLQRNYMIPLSVLSDFFNLPDTVFS